MMHDFWKDYSGTIIQGLMISAIVGLVGMIRGFFLSIRKLKTKVFELEKRLDENERNDEELKEWVDDMIKQKMRNHR